MPELTVSMGTFQIAGHGRSCADSGFLRRYREGTVFTLVEGACDGMSGKVRTSLAAAVLAEQSGAGEPPERWLASLRTLWSKTQDETLPSFALLRVTASGLAELYLHRLPPLLCFHQGRRTVPALEQTLISGAELAWGTFRLREGDDLLFYTRGLLQGDVKNPRSGRWDSELLFALLDPLVAAGTDGPGLAKEISRAYRSQCRDSSSRDASCFVLHFLSAPLRP